MGQKSGFFTSNGGDRKYGADWLAQFTAAIISNGVYTTELTASGDNGNMSVTVGTGRAWINGYMYSNDADMTLALAAADGVLSRTDLVVLRLNMTNRQIALAIVQGTFGGGVPAITRTADIYELELAKIAVAAGTTAITQAMITDTRADETVCGIVAGAVTQLSTGELLNQLKSGFDTWFANIKGQLSTDAAGNLQNEIDALPSTLKVTAATAAKLFASPVGTETVDQVLSLLGRFQRSLGNEYVWEKKICTNPTYTLASGSSQKIAFYKISEYTQIPYYDAVSVDFNGTVNMVGMHTLTYADDSPSPFEILRGKYVFGRGTWNNQESDKYYIPTDAVFSSSYDSDQAGYNILCDKAQLVTGVAGFYTSEGYVNSPDSGTYPPAEPDGYTYTALGEIGNKVQIATVSYVGTGTYGANNPCSLTLPFVPKLILLVSTGTSATDFLPRSQYYSASLYMPLVTTQYVQKVGFCNNSSNDSLPTYLYGKKSSDGKTIMWYNTYSAAGQCNENGVQHNLIALG